MAKGRARHRDNGGKRATPPDRRVAAKPAARPHNPSKRAAWGLLVYLAGDTDQDAGNKALAADLSEILKAGGSADLTIFVQHDGPEGGARYIVPARSAPNLAPAERMGRVDSGRTAALLDFLRWGLSSCDAERMALVIGSPLAVSPGMGERNPDRVNVFSLTFDQGSGNYLDVAEVAGVMRVAMQDAGRPQIDLLAIDSCHVQFLELAYELEDIVRILIAPQTAIPLAGWDYGRMLARWKKLVASERPPTTPQLASALLDDIITCYDDDKGVRAVSALDLQRLDDLSHAFDTLCIATLQVLGEGLIWKARGLLLTELNETTDGPVYDCGSFFSIWGAALDAMADESYQGWLGTTLERRSGTTLDRFCEGVARHLEVAMADAPARPPLDLAGAPSAERLTLLVDLLKNHDGRAAGNQLMERLPAGVRERIELLRRRAPAGSVARKDLTRLADTLQQHDPPDALERFMERLSAGVKERIELLKHGTAEESAARKRLAQATDQAVRAAIEKAWHMLPDERQFDLRRMEEAAANARRLADQSHRALIALLGDPSKELRGMVLAARSAPAVESGWPRWSGVSMYRPGKLDDLMNAGYQSFAFHRRVHWAALLGAANLIDQHPRALWRLVSSLLATGSAVTRRDVLRRLTGPDSVIWGLREQFQVMAPAPTLTLSLERRGPQLDGDSAPTVDGDSTPSADAAPAAGTPVAHRRRENYVLRLESASRGAIVTEQDSRVQPEVMNRALQELNTLLQQPITTTRSLTDLRSIGGLLGEDIFQSLGRTLEDEREAIRAVAPDVTPHLQLQIPRDLMRYPWELLHHHGEWLGERYAMGRQVFMETGLARRVPGRRQGRVRALIIGDPIFDAGLGWRQLPGARDEAEQVAGWFERTCQEVGSTIDFNRERDTRIHCRLTRAEMRALLREGIPGEGCYDIVHFAGHGVFRADDPETSAWLLSDGELWSLEIRNTLTEHAAPPWLVFANACEAGMDAARPERKYQGNVFGLATAFINQGVAAYIAPLWPIDDLLAQYIALEFYRQLLSERATLGEALRRAKAGARRLAYPPRTTAAAADETVWAGLGWASLVLYGDPTEELFQALAGGSHQQRTQSPAASAERSRPSQMAERSMSQVLHAPDHVISRWVKGPTWARLDQRGGANAQPGDVVLELIEDAGLRRWRVQRPGAGRRGANGNGNGNGNGQGDALPGSQIAALLADDRVRTLLPARRGMLRVIGRWVVSGFKEGTLGLVREYDREQVKDEGLLIAKGPTSAELVSALGNGARVLESSPSRARALVLIHGTFSKTASPVDGFGPQFMEWARQRYRVVLGFDHWTLSKTPQENAELLADELRSFSPDLMKVDSLDLITHSRGGLVARAFCELEGHVDAVRNLIFLGTPNCGTDLANPKNWGSFADLLVNMTGVDGAELFGRLAGLLAQLAVGGVISDVPGLLAQSPEAVADTNSFLYRLQNPKNNRGKVRYGVICSEFEPTALVPNVKQIMHAAKEIGLDASMDALFAGANDLVVNTAHAWGIALSPKEVGNLPTFLTNKRVLMFTPPRTEFTPPKGVLTETALGVHHCNLFSQPRVRETIKAWLTEA